MSGPSDYQPTNPVMKWIERRLPIFGLVHSSFVVYPTPRNLNYWWTFGAILSMMLGLQVLTGVILAMHYTPNADLAFKSVESIVRDVNYGWLLRNMHATGASMFFFAVYIHMFRGLYYGSYKEPREVLWILGVIIYLLMMATGFMGYVLPWGQMSFWGATVITNLFSAIPYFGESIVTLLWGGYSVGNPTLNRFFSLHYLLPFVIAGVVVLHIWALHVAGQNNPAGVEPKTAKDTLAFTPYATLVKEGKLRGLAVTGDERAPLSPDTPTLAELGHKELTYRQWFALYTPAGVPKPVMNRLVTETAKSLNDSDLRQRFTQAGVDAAPTTPEQMAAIVRRDLDKWAKVIKVAGIKLE